MDPELIGDPSQLDLALLNVPRLVDALPPISVAVVDRDTSTGTLLDGCWTLGYPAFQEFQGAGHGHRVRETAQVGGRIAPLSGLVGGLLSMEVTMAPRELPTRGTLDESQWSGMSGAAVFAGDALIGVVSEHVPRRGPTDITVTPLQLLAEPGIAPPNARQWWELLSVGDPLSLQRLPVVATRPDPPYKATVRVIRARTKLLVGREDEIARISAFAAGEDDAFASDAREQGYAWLAGGAWAGKTALLAEAVGALPPQVDVVTYFLTARASQASQEQFLVAVVPQLAWLLSIEPPGVIDVHLFRDLWARAAQQAQANGRHLLLVVDGLDEDLRPGGLSIAALLPADELGPHARVLVTSRSHYALPHDVDADHPLRTTPMQTVVDSGRGEELRVRAEQEIAGILNPRASDTKNQELAFDVLGLLTAASGALSVDDLAAMADRPARAVRAFITDRSARTLEPVGAQDELRYQFAHQTLLEHCQQHPDVGGDPDYRRQLHRWAEKWNAEGWPTSGMSNPSTPRYLLDAYPATLAGRSSQPPDPADLQRLLDLASDIRWADTAITRVGVDPVLTCVRGAAQFAPHHAGLATTQLLLEVQAHRLRPPSPVNQPGYVACALAWEALRLGEAGLSQATSARLQQYPEPQLTPVCTTEHTSRHLVRELGRYSKPVLTLAITAHGLVASGGEDGVVRLWDPVVPLDPGRVLGRHDGYVTAVATTADGFVVSAGYDGTVSLWDPSDPGAPGRTIGQHLHGVSALAATEDGLVVSAGLLTVWLWDPSDPDDRGRMIGDHPSCVTALAVTSDGCVVSGGEGAVRLWDPAVPDHRSHDVGFHDAWVTALAVTQDRRVVSGANGVVRLWDPAAPDGHARKIGRHDGWVSGLAVTADGQVVSGGADGAVRVWDPTSPEDQGRQLGRHGRSVTAVAVAPNGLVVSSGSDGAVRLWDPSIADDPRITDRNDHRVGALALTSDRRVVYSSDDGALRLWDPAFPDDPHREFGRGRFLRVAVTSDDLVVSGGNDGTLRLWDPAVRNDPGREIGQHPHGVTKLTSTRDGRVVSGGWDGTLRLWDLAVPDDPGREVGRHDGSVNGLAVTAGGCVVSGGDDRVVRIWDPAVPDDPGRDVGRHEAGIGGLTVTLDGFVVCGLDDGTVWCWDPALPDDPGREIGRHNQLVTAVVAICDGRVASYGYDGTLRLWDPRVCDDDGHELFHHDELSAFAAGTDDGLLVVGTRRGITVFEITGVRRLESRSPTPPAPVRRHGPTGERT